MTMAYATYRALTSLSAPFLKGLLRARLKKGKELETRLPERWGVAAVPRPQGALVWVHAASVGEAVSILEIITRLRRDYPHTSVLMTTGSVTSARLMQERLPKGVIHQFIPIDHPAWVERFINHWTPSLVLWAESELWPNLLMTIQRRAIPAILVNARMSDRSFLRWQTYVPALARQILATFDLALAQDEGEAQRLRRLGIAKVKVSGNIKYAASPLPVDEARLKDFKNAIGARPCWLMSSTHPGEELIAADIHVFLKARFPRLLTIIVPRHPYRGDEIAEALRARGLSVVQRSKQETVSPCATCDIYLADTLGELGLFYRAISISVIGGSFVPQGGHNLIEPAQLGSTILFGPYMHNFLGIEADFLKAGAAVRAETLDDLKAKLLSALSGIEDVRGYADAALQLTARKSGILDHIMGDLVPFLKGRPL